jgi:tetratricopeptide (TPR) repeat protein
MEDQEELQDIIKELSELLAKLLVLKKSGKFQGAIDLIDDALVRHFDFDAANTNYVSEEFLNEVYEQKCRISPDINDSLGELLAEKGNLLYSQHRYEESRNILNNALTIYFLLNDNQDFFSFGRMNKMVMINQKLASIDLNISR